MAAPSRTLFDENLVKDLFSKVRGKSTLAKLSAQEGIPFNGTKHFTFSMDDEVDIVAENGKHTAGRVSFEPVIMVPLEFEYGTRLSKEFVYASEEEQINYLQAFNDGFAKKLARGLDIAAMHGYNPRTGATAAVIGENYFDAKVTDKVTYSAGTADDNIDAAIKLVSDHDGDTTGIAMSKTLASDMSKIKANGVTVYPEFRFGGVPTNLNGIAVDANVTVSKGPTGSLDHAIVGDFQNAFKWGFGKTVETELIQYGDPDNTGKDLKGYGQVYLRATAYIGWGILAPDYFALVQATA